MSEPGQDRARHCRSRLRMLGIALIVALLAAVPAGCGLGPTSNRDALTIYASRPENVANSVVARFEQAYPQYRGKVRMLTMGAGEVVDRVTAEGRRPQADIWWGGTQQQFEQGVQEGVLEPAPAEVVGRVPERFRGEKNLWLGEMRMAQMMFYNHDMLPPEQAPKDWDDLLDPKWRDKILIRDVAASGTMRSVYAALIARAPNTEAGFDTLRRLDANTKDYAPNPSDLYLRVQRQEAPVSIWNLQDVLIQRAKGAPFTPVVPASGAPVLIDGVAKIKHGPNPPAADAFLEFLLRESTQARLAEESFQLPTIPLDRAPTWSTEIPVREMPIDWEQVSAHEKEWIGRWNQQVKGRG